jgi:hypothetical protein
MNRLSTALFSVLMTGTLLGIGVTGQAQTNIIELSGNVPKYVVPGQTFTLDLFSTQNNPNSLTTTVQTVFRTESDLSVTWTRASGLNPTVVIKEGVVSTANVASGEYAGVNTFLSTTYGFLPTGRTLAPHTLIGTYTITIREDAVGTIDFGLTQSSLAGNGLIQSPALSGTLRSSMTTMSPSLLNTSFLGSNFQEDWMLPNRPGSYRVTVVPEPNPIFALGCLVPAMALWRRRRTAR